MTLRPLAALAFTAGTVVLITGLTVLGMAPGSPEDGRHLRKQKSRTGVPSEVTAVTIADIQQLPHGRPLAEVAAIEARGVLMEGYVQRMLLAGDGDLHLELAPTQRAPGGADTLYVTAEISPSWRHGSTSWQHEALRERFRPNHGGPAPWESGPKRVRLTGWLLYDGPYDRQPSRWSLENAAPRVSGWEIHPVTRIEVWDEALAAWTEVVR